ncbi:MAG: hypothetical protein KJ964_11380 [Verrucomicrobia bacterium]|nr:hypothetical protein [Verrucomicrobiota bacterium]MBU1734571.1 hypothetical protein [Verrucomicrobiota bacterium]
MNFKKENNASSDDFGGLCLDGQPAWEQGHWPIFWIWHPEAHPTGNSMVLFKLEFEMTEEDVFPLHVSADNRYHIFLDGQLLGMGPERGIINKWFYETYRIRLKPGRHKLLARVWHIEERLAPHAQVSYRGGFILLASGRNMNKISTGLAPWQTCQLNGFGWEESVWAWGGGSNMTCDGRLLPWDCMKGGGDGWVSPVVLESGEDAKLANPIRGHWLLAPATLPPCLNHGVDAGAAGFKVCYAGNFNPALRLKFKHASCRLPGEPEISLSQITEPVLNPANNLETDEWQKLLEATDVIHIPPRSAIEAIIDLNDYYCAYTDLVVSEGRNAVIKIEWAEALYRDPLADDKGNRDEVFGKFFIGDGDTFIADGGSQRHFETFWWRSGRYLRISVITGESSLLIEKLAVRETRYPLDYEGALDCDNKELLKIVRPAVRSLQECMHETYMDCPHYEQMMYVGDTRIMALAGYVISADRRMQQKAIELGASSIQVDRGDILSRYPSRVAQFFTISALAWIDMVYDFFLWRNADDVRRYLPAMRFLMHSFEGLFDGHGLIRGTRMWNYIDWASGWPGGVPPDGDTGAIAHINLLYLLALQKMTALEEYFGEDLLAERNRRQAADLKQAILNYFWDDSREMLADQVSRKTYSEHAQVLAVMADLLDDRKKAGITEKLVEEKLIKTSVYFNHYYFEAAGLLGRMDLFFRRLDSCYGAMLKQGCRTFFETPDPARSDCHGWGVSPMFHFLATMLGIRPASPGFANVAIKPRPGNLRRLSGALPHYRGMIHVDLQIEEGKIEGKVSLPKGVKGRFYWKNSVCDLSEGATKIEIT